MRLHFPRPGPAVLGLMIACGVMFLLPLVVGEGPLFDWLALWTGRPLRVWTYVTFQFLHADVAHVLFNLLSVYFFAPALEQRWGSWRFLLFYLACGCAAGACFLLLGLAGARSAHLVGASGGAMACVAACAILRPDIRVFLLPIRWVAGGLLGLYVLGAAGDVARPETGGVSNAAHLGGMVMGGVLAWVWRDRTGVGGGAWTAFRQRLRRGAWQRKQEALARRQAEVDRILDKVHREGIQSLTAGEKKTLQEETRRQREEEHADKAKFRY